MENNRINLLHSIIRMDSRYQESLKLISRLPFDSDFAYTITKNDILDILERFQKSNLSSDQLECWANFIEGRDDIEFEKEISEKGLIIIQELANPILFDDLNENTIANLIIYLHE